MSKQQSNPPPTSPPPSPPPIPGSEAELTCLQAEVERQRRVIEAMILHAQCWIGDAKVYPAGKAEGEELLGGNERWLSIVAGVRKLQTDAEAGRRLPKDADRNIVVPYLDTVYSVHGAMNVVLYAGKWMGEQRRKDTVLGKTVVRTPLERCYLSQADQARPDGCGPESEGGEG